MQSFLGSLSYYSRFIEDFAVYATVLYELSESDFHEMRRANKINSADLEPGDDPTKVSEDDHWAKAKIAFIRLKEKIVATPTLRHFDPSQIPVIVLYANKWAISAALMQEYDGVYWPVTLTSRTLKSNEINYGIVDKEVLALLRILDACYTQLVTRPIKVLSPYSTLAWLLNSSCFDGRIGKWAVLLSDWTLEITKCVRGEEEILGAIAASITPRAEADEALVAIAPRKQPRKNFSTPLPTIGPEEELLVASFDGSVRTRRRVEHPVQLSGSSQSGPSSNRCPITAKTWPSTKVNTGAPVAFRSAIWSRQGTGGDLRDSNLVIRQMRGEINCKAPGLELLRQKALDRLQSWPQHDFLHVKRDWNQSADRLASAALRRQEGDIVFAEEDRKGLMTLNRLDELLRPKPPEVVVHVSAMARGRNGSRPRSTILAEDITADKAKACSKIASEYEVDEANLLFFCPRPETTTGTESSSYLSWNAYSKIFYIIITPVSSEGIRASEERTRGLDGVPTGEAYTERNVGECTDCKTGKGRPSVQGESPGNIQGTYPFQVISMGHIPSLPRSSKGNTELLIWADVFSGYVIVKTSSSREAQTIAENYEECVFRRFGASEVIRHDREPGFMSDFFRAFNRMVKVSQSATIAYRPQANGKAERTVQTLTRALKMYVADVNQQDWDNFAERLTFVLNTAQDTTRGDTSFYLVHGWDPRSTLEAVMPIGSTRKQDVKLREAIRSRAEQHNKHVRPHSIEEGTRVWLYLDRVKEGFARKLAHMQHGPFRVAELIGNHAARLETTGSGYRIFPIVYLSKLNPVKTVPDRPVETLTIEECDRVDFDEALLREDCREIPLEDGEYEVEQIIDVPSGRRTRYGRVHKEYKVRWKGYDEPSWVDEADLNCGVLLHEYERDGTSRNRFSVMQSHEEEGSRSLRVGRDDCERRKSAQGGYVLRKGRARSVESRLPRTKLDEERTVRLCTKIEKHA
ncbi:LOW QUALITY PROTEIN: Reverse transcriptase [Phytophthora palmivora]|uniref:Reverse transcriptase n=1 Tax=Phytophthora palmivora TaxID=4796 RepID=A0A2P4YM74_9STRA|nr:LOW QUALITY PROTEIN: Reverse transcriptase [Phytophthora palmivora]